MDINDSIRFHIKWKHIIEGYIVTFEGKPYKIGGQPYYKTYNTTKRYLIEWIFSLLTTHKEWMLRYNPKQEGNYFLENGYSSVEGDQQERYKLLKVKAKDIVEKFLNDKIFVIEPLNHQ